MSAQGEQNSPPGPARFTALLDECRSIAVRHLGMLSTGVFESTGDALLEFADKAESNAMQAQFFEAIQAIGRGRHNMKRAFEGEIKIGFAQFIKGRPLAVAGGAEHAEHVGKQKTVTGFDISGMQILDKLAHEESAVIQTLAAKSGNRYLEQLYALSQRLAIVNGGTRVEEAALPTGPTHILNAFNASIRPLRLLPNIKLVLFAVFDRVVMTQLEPLYEELNLCLLKAGVLPNLRPSVAKNASSGAPTNKTAHTGQDQQFTSRGHQGGPSGGQSTASSDGHAAAAGGLGAASSGGHAAASSGQGAASSGNHAESSGGQRVVVSGGQYTSASAQSARSEYRGGMSAYQAGGGSGSRGGGWQGADGGGDSSGEPSMGDQLFSTICGLMASCRQAERAAAAAAAGTDLSHMEADAGPPVEPYADNTVLVSAISRLQVEHALPGGEFDPAQIEPERVDKGVLEAIRSHLLSQRQRIYKGVDRRRVPQVEIDVIDVVGMLFDCILNDEVLPNAVKALLSRLHTPYLKIAILDKRMFSSEKHPARRLLNTMAEAGAKWVSQDHLQAGIYPQMRYVVDRVLNEFQDGLQLFEDLIEEFAASVEVLEEKAALIEQRAREAAKGNEKLQLARDRAQQELAARTVGKHLPNVARKFLTEIWADHLMLIMLRSRGGESSQDFVEALRIADEIIWSVTPKHSPEEREQLSLRLPKLQHIIEDELGSLGGYSKDEQEDLYSLLKDLQANALHGTATEADTADAVELSSDTVVETLPLEVTHDAITAEEQVIIDDLRKLNFGTLFDFTINPAGDTRRLKLSWFSQVTSNYMFVDQTGVKAAVHNIRDLARTMREGNARVVAEHNKPFFEWALETIRNMLKGSVKEQ